MNLRNVDGSPEMLESGDAHFYSRILFVNSSKRQRGYSENAHLALRALGTKSVGFCWIDGKVGRTLGSLLVAFVVTFTVAGSLALGVALAYTGVLGLLHLFAYRSRKPAPALVLVTSQNHASGD